MTTELDLPSQARLVAGLQRAMAFDHPSEDLQHLQTHISHVLLAGTFAYKIKKPVDFGFLDFSSLAKRRHCCEEELRLNSRLADNLYLDVVPITGSLEAPHFGGDGEALDYAVRMRRFPQEALLNRQAVTPELIDRVAERAVRFHREIPAASADSPFGTPERVLFPMQQNFDQIRPLLDDPRELARLTPLENWTCRAWERLRPLLQARKQQGHIRECHGDMHLGNIALVAGEVIIFDGIEFNPDLRWIDTVNELAFLIMDLEQAGQATLARRALNRYLELSGDYEALPLVDFYKLYRALVRAKVTALRLGQSPEPAERAAVLAEYGRYLTLAESYIQDRSPALILTHGVSGSGKSVLSGWLLEALDGAIRIRSDVERKRLFGLEESERSGSPPDGGIYTLDAGARTYSRLHELARLILEAGYSALVDATFLKRSQREAFLGLARNQERPLVILSLEATVDQLRDHVTQRQAAGVDPSEASLDILERQLRTREPLSDQERTLTISLDVTAPPSLEQLVKRLRGMLKG